MRTLLAAVMMVSLGACSTIDLTQYQALPKSMATLKDRSLPTPSWEFSETDSSNRVIVGASFYAQLNSCQFIQRYKARTNQNFTSTLNLVKNRAYRMGAKWITIIHHSETDWTEESPYLETSKVEYITGTQINESRYITTLVADLYDCPCNTQTCSNR